MKRTAVIVVGGSAGSLEALLVLLPELPATFAVPAVIVMHMSAHHPSLLPEILARKCRLPVVEIEDKQPLIAGTIYVAAPGYHVLFERDGTLAGPDLRLLSGVRAVTDGVLLAAGGFAELAHIAAARDAGCDGAVVGRALYDGTLNLREALNVARA